MTNLFMIGQWAQHMGLVGEKHNFLTGAVVMISGKNMGFGIESPSGSGKSVIADLLVGDSEDNSTSLIYSKHVYYKDAGSQTSFFADADMINQKKIIFFKELQKDKTDMTVEAIKSITEGKSANRRVNMVTKQKVINQEIKPKTVIFTLAIENDTKPDPELRRRCISVTTDVSKEQTKKVLQLKAQMRFDKDCSKILTEKEAENIRRNVNSLFLQDFKIANPFATCFADIVSVISPDQKIRSMMEHFWDVLEGVTKLNYLDHRVEVGNNVILANVQDLLQTLDIYKQSFLRDVYSIPPMGDIILRGFEDAAHVEATVKSHVVTDLSAFGASNELSTKWIDVNHLRKAIKEKQKVVLSKNVVIQICRGLVDSGYLEDWKDGQVIKYQIQEKFREFDQPNAKELIEHAAKLVKEKYPQHFDEWYKLQFASYQHPITGEEIKIE